MIQSQFFLATSTSQIKRKRFFYQDMKNTKGNTQKAIAPTHRKKRITT